MTEDAELLRRFATERDDAAFAELVRRHIDLVHSAALRQLNGDAHLAEDATQLVFADLARKAGTVAGERVLAAWLLVSTRFATSKLVRSERRRQAREQEAHLMQQLSEPSGDTLDWTKVRPVLDVALGELNQADRDAILLRFFEGRAFAEVGSRLQVNENTARMRVDRALDKLHALLTRRGVTSTTGALAVALANQAVMAAPAGLAASVTGAILGGVAGAGALTAGAGATAGATFMSITKLQLGLGGLVAAVGLGGFVVQQRAADDWQREIEALAKPAGEIAALKAENLRLARAAADAERWPQEEADLERTRTEARSLQARVDSLTQARRAAETAAAARRAKAAALQLNQDTDRLPRPSSRVQPKYPAALKKAGVTGEVLVSFVVGSDGTVRDVKAIKSSRPEFEAAAVEAVAASTFEPGLKGNRPVNTRLEQAIKFTVGDSSAPASEAAPASDNDWF